MVPLLIRPGLPGPACPRPWWRLAIRLDVVNFDATLGYPGEGPQLPRSTPTPKSETLTLLTANVTSWSTGTDAGAFASETEVFIFQEVRLKGDSLRAARSEAWRAKYHGTWAAAKRVGPCGPASGGLATLVCETRAFRCAGPHWKEGRWTHTAIGAGGTQVHVINVYGWPFGTPDLWKCENTLWKEMFSHVAGLGYGPWVMAGDWNATPDQLRMPALAPRTSGWLPDVGGTVGGPLLSRAKGSPQRRISTSSATASEVRYVTDYEFMPVGALPTHRAARLTLKLAAFREPVGTFRKPRIISHPEPGGGDPQAAHQAPWTRLGVEAPGAQPVWDAWTKAAEDWLLGRAGISQEEEEPYKGRGAAPIVRMRMPFPIATHRGHSEVHGRAKVWTAQANRYRESARAREEHRQHYGDLLVAAIAANPPRRRDPIWTQKDLKIASGRATPEDIGVRALEAKDLAEEENWRVTAARRKAWNDWVATSWIKSLGKVYAWCRTERPAPIFSTTDAQGN